MGNSFGGRAFDRYVFENETVAEADALGAAPVAPAAPAEPEWSGVGRDDWERMVESHDSMASFLNELYGVLNAPEPTSGVPAEPAAPAAPQATEADAAAAGIPLEQLQAIIDAKFDEMLGPIRPVLDLVVDRESKQVADQFLETLKGEIGDFDRDYAVTLGKAYMHANPDLDAEKALRFAAQQTFELQERSRLAGAGAQTTQLQNAANADNAPAAGAPGTAVTPIDGRMNARDRYEKMATDWLEQRRAAAAGSTAIG